jgi:hypothetical protein
MVSYLKKLLIIYIYVHISEAVPRRTLGGPTPRRSNEMAAALMRVVAVKAAEVTCAACATRPGARTRPPAALPRAARAHISPS